MASILDKNTLFYGDNLPILKEYIPDESIDLIYLDPPFNSNRSYNILFKDESGSSADAQISAFEDTWHWNAATERTYHEIITNAPGNVAEMIDALRSFIGENQMMAYLVMMAARLSELHRVLKPTGSLYLHCDPTASHYLKVVLDAIFGVDKFGNEVIWKRTNAKGLAFTRFASNHDVIFRYTKTNKWTWNQLFIEHDPEYLATFYKYIEPGTGRRYRLDNLSNPNKDRPNLTYEFLGITRVWRWTKERMQDAYNKGIVVQIKPGAVPALKRYLDEQEGTPIGDTWIDIPPIQARGNEGLGYPTQKPLSLLERIIGASSNQGDIVLDPFCGCGTAIAAAEKLSRRWIGIDVTHLAISLIKYRMKDMFSSVQYQVIGEPQDFASAKQLARDDRYQFQWWALSLVRAKPLGGREGSKQGKKGKDAGIDGLIYFFEANNELRRVIVQVKSGHVQRKDIGDLRGVLERENAALAVFITLEEPTRDMITEAASASFYTSPLWQKDYSKIQIITIEQLLNGVIIDMPPAGQAFKQAERVKPTSTQATMNL